ncbi:MAG: phosphotransferase [Armatimonadota bacterium]
MGVFGLSAAQVFPIVEAAAGTPLSAVGDASLPDSEDKGLVTFPCITQSGNPVDVPLFVKRCVWEGRPESIHYRHLTSHGVPMPRLYGAVRDTAGIEVIFLEPVTATGFNRKSDREWRALLTLMAQFTACSVDAQYLPHLRRYEPVVRLGENGWILGLPSPTDADMATALKTCGVTEERMSGYVAAARALFNRVAAHPRGLLHQDFLPNNFGWRGERSEMVVFDVHKNALGPRFADVAPYLYLSDWGEEMRAFLLEGGPDDSRITSLFRHFLDEYGRFAGAAVSYSELHQEIADLVWANKTASLVLREDIGKAASANLESEVLPLLERLSGWKYGSHYVRYPGT